MQGCEKNAIGLRYVIWTPSTKILKLSMSNLLKILKVFKTPNDFKVLQFPQISMYDSDYN